MNNKLYVFLHNLNDMNQNTNLRLRHMEIFSEVARLSSISRAAETLGMAQPGVTRSIRELEQICGCALFEKSGRGIQITPRGQMFQRYAAASLSAARTGLAEIQKLADLDSPPLRIGALPTVSATVVPIVVDQYLLAGANSRLQISTGENRVLLDQLAHDELDLMIGRLAAPELMRGMVFEPLYRDKVIFVVHHTHRLASERSISNQSMDEFPMLMPSHHSIIRPFVDRLFLEQGLRESVRTIDTVSDSFGRAFVRDHEAIWIISSGVVSNELASGDFVALPINTDTTLGSIGLTRRADAPDNPAVKLFGAQLRALDLSKFGSAT